MGDGLLIPPRRGEQRSPERIRAHYEIERALAERLRRSKSADERRELFSGMYEELFSKVPDHPRMAARGAQSACRERDIQWNLAQLKPCLKPGCVFLEIGAGDCALSEKVATLASRVYAVDISDQTRGRPLPQNVRIVLTDGRSIDVPEASVDLAFSDQLMEHLHPDDALEQLRNIHRALKPGGVYVCVTPNRLYGPSDVSAYFDEVASGFHLREYSLREIRRTFLQAGFARANVFVGARGFFARCPAQPLEALEAVLERLPYRLRRRVADTSPLRALLGCRVAATKESA
jgi:SAM-dependent methyltransferase